MPVNIAICCNRRAGSELCDRFAESEALRGVRFLPVLFESGEALLDELKSDSQRFDMVVLSTTVTGKNSLDVARKLRAVDPDCPLILYSPNRELALESYEVAATGFLVQPYTQKQLDLFLRRAVAQCGRKSARDIFFVKVKQNFVPLSEADLVFAESNLKYLLLHMVDGTIVRTMMTLDGLMELLKGKQFLITQKSYLINMDYVTDVAPFEFKLGNYGAAAITQRRYPQIRNQYFAYNERHQPIVTAI